MTVAEPTPSPEPIGESPSAEPEDSDETPDTQAVPSAKEPEAQAPSSPRASADRAEDGASALVSPSPSSSESPIQVEANQTLGAAGLPMQVRSLAKAFTRALPKVFEHDPSWRKLAVGTVGSFNLRLEIDERGMLADAKPLEDNLRPELSELIRRIKLFLRMGRFRGETAAGEPFVEVLEVEIEVLQSEPAPDFEPHQVAEFHQDPPGLSVSGLAYIRFGSGRRVEARVRFRRDLRDRAPTP